MANDPLIATFPVAQAVAPVLQGAAPSVPLYLVGQDQLEGWFRSEGEIWCDWVRGNSFKARAGEVCVLPAAGLGAGFVGGQAIAGAIVGYGTEKDRNCQRFLAANTQRCLPGLNWRLVADITPVQMKEFTLGWYLDSYSFGRYQQNLSPHDARLLCPSGVSFSQISAMAEGEFFTRDLINTPANHMGPDQLQKAFLDLASLFDAQTKVIMGNDLLNYNFPMIHAVGAAAESAPRLLEMFWGKEDAPSLTLVGKGVCFDTGGLNIKPGSSMGLMKKDMGGAAAVMGLALMIMRLNLPLRLRVLVPAVENAISGNAVRPGDILTSRKGLSVEINNTDAEGRLVLADALAYACEGQKTSDIVVSMATLTGAARVALGPELVALFANDQDLAMAIETGGTLGFDPVWRMPFWNPYEKMIEPEIADLDNAPKGGFAGAITAALFLRRFVEGPRYAHFDIYGYSPVNAPGCPKGGLGQGARAVLHALPELLGLSL